ncbi:hypothetical protein QNA27_09160 [Pantoea eucalypti]|uniref:hypothetical protein n=1 Tax=Pantoea eucalypti TaxID=470933 RepID=UPI0024BB1AB0|nr:hypothetical protein [Pantoea eucalypti]MDJ0473818.1 hypothetical protein [Pantoea eucalypti]
MTLEQRVEALEKAVARLTLPSATAEELAKLMRGVAKETIKNTRRPGGILHCSGGNETADVKATVRYEAGMGVSI